MKLPPVSVNKQGSHLNVSLGAGAARTAGGALGNGSLDIILLSVVLLQPHVPQAKSNRHGRPPQPFIGGKLP